MSNKKEAGVLNFLTYRNRETGTYCGLCVELGLYGEADNLETLRTDLAEAARGYVHTVMRDNLADELLEVEPTPEVVAIYQEAIKSFRPLDLDSSDQQGAYSPDVTVFTKTTQPLEQA